MARPVLVASTTVPPAQADWQDLDTVYAPIGAAGAGQLCLPRVATAAECKAFLIARAYQLIVDMEHPVLQAAALQGVVVPPVDMT